MDYDKSLVRKVYGEEVKRGDITWTISACLTRFGGLCVIAFNDYDDRIWQGDNIIECRNWVDTE